MNAPFWFEAAAKSAILAVLTLLTLWFIRRGPAANRHFVLKLGVAALLLIPISGLLAPKWYVVTPEKSSLQVAVEKKAAARTAQAAAPTGVPLMALAALEQATRLLQPVPSPTPAVPPAPVAAPTAPPDYSGLAWLWALGTVVLGARLAAGIARVRTLCTKSRALTSRVARNSALYAEMAAATTSKTRFKVAPKDCSVMPMTWGWMNPVVLLPSDFEGWPESRQRATLSHEIAHIKRGDWLWLVLGTFATCLFWFNPLVWIMNKQMRRTAELACDDLVIEFGIQPSHYAAQLLEVVKHMNPTRKNYKIAVQMAGDRNLEGRLRSILSPSRRRSGMARWATLAWTAIAVCALAPVAALTFQDPPKDPPKPPKPWESPEKKAPKDVIVAPKVWSGTPAPKAQEAKKAEATAKVKAKLKSLDKKIDDLKSKKDLTESDRTKLEVYEAVREALNEVLSEIGSGGFVFTPGTPLAAIPHELPGFNKELMKELATIAPKIEGFTFDGRLPQDSVIVKSSDGKITITKDGKTTTYDQKDVESGKVKLPDGIKLHGDRISVGEMNHKQMAELEKHMAEMGKKMRIDHERMAKELTLAMPKGDWKGLSEMDAKRFAELGQKYQTLGLDQARAALESALKGIESKYKAGDMSKSDYEAAVKGIKTALESLKKAKVKSGSQPSAPPIEETRRSIKDRLVSTQPRYRYEIPAQTLVPGVKLDTISVPTILSPRVAMDAITFTPKLEIADRFMRTNLKNSEIDAMIQRSLERIRKREAARNKQGA